MWQEIITHLSCLYGESFTNPEVLAVGGGSINQTYRLRLSGYDFFVKLNAAPKISMFEAEVSALREIQAAGKIRVPEPIGWGVAGDKSYLTLEWIDLDGPKNWQDLARSLAGLHSVRSIKGFGWQQNNTIGETPQRNPWTENWADFFWHHRLLYQLKLADGRGFKPTLELAQIEEWVYSILADHQVVTSLVHGDLWSGNFGFDREGNPVIFDPALYYGDREVDLAMTELFGGFSPQFYEFYGQIYPIDGGYRQRKNIYNLYHILNHFNLFGGSYANQAESMINSLGSKS